MVMQNICQQLFKIIKAQKLFMIHLMKFYGSLRFTYTQNIIFGRICKMKLGYFLKIEKWNSVTWFGLSRIKGVEPVCICDIGSCLLDIIQVMSPHWFGYPWTTLNCCEGISSIVRASVMTAEGREFKTPSRNTFSILPLVKKYYVASVSKAD